MPVRKVEKMPNIYFPQYARGRDGLKLYPGESVLEHIPRMDGVEIDSEKHFLRQCRTSASRWPVKIPRLLTAMK